MTSGVLQAGLLDPALSSTTAPNFVYKTATLTLGQTITNTSGEAITALSLRFTAMTTIGSASNDAVLAAQGFAGRAVTVPGVTATVAATALANSAVLADGGGMGSKLVVTLPGGALAAGASINVDLVFDVTRSGSYSFTYQPETSFSSG